MLIYLLQTDDRDDGLRVIDAFATLDRAKAAAQHNVPNIQLYWKDPPKKNGLYAEASIKHRAMVDKFLDFVIEEMEVIDS